MKTAVRSQDPLVDEIQTRVYTIPTDAPKRTGPWPGTPPPWCRCACARGRRGASEGTNPARDLDRLRQARKVIGDDVELYADANGGYSRKQAIRVAHAATEHDLRWFEEPVSSDDLAGLREVRDAVEADVTAGEYGFDLTYFRRMCQAGAVDCLQVDATRCGGITEWMRAAAVAAAHGLEVSGHCAPQLHVHMAAATPNLRHLEWFHAHVRIEKMLFDGTLNCARQVFETVS